MLEITCNDRLGKKVRVKCKYPSASKEMNSLPLYCMCFLFLSSFRYTIFKDHITLNDYEIHDGMNLELYYQ
eukprot:XP_014776854.1 PREDICTED: ubiquitin-like protein 5 [Octopus bimaculoides]